MAKLSFCIDTTICYTAIGLLLFLFNIFNTKWLFLFQLFLCNFLYKIKLLQIPLNILIANFFVFYLTTYFLHFFLFSITYFIAVVVKLSKFYLSLQNNTKNKIFKQLLLVLINCGIKSFFCFCGIWQK